VKKGLPQIEARFYPYRWLCQRLTPLRRQFLRSGVGVILDIVEREKPELDHAEGLGNGYGKKSANVLDESEQQHPVVLYVADG
jgi:hypothetical protein